MRSMWMGMLNFGLVSMPVKLYSAVSSKTVHFKHLHASDHSRVYTKRFCPVDEEEVAFDELVRGYEIAPERYVVIEDDELAALAPEFTRTIEIEDFVELEEIDRIYLDQSYYVVPNKGGARSYRLLQQAMTETGKVAIARVVLRSRERLVAIRPREDALLMTTMNFGDEVQPISELRELGDFDMQVGERELSTGAVAICVQFAALDGTGSKVVWREPSWLPIPQWENFSTKSFAVRFPGAPREFVGFVVRTYYRKQMQDIAATPPSLRPLAPLPLLGGAS